MSHGSTTATCNEEDDDDEDEMDSADEALCAMLGIKSVIKGIAEEEGEAQKLHYDETTTTGGGEAALLHNNYSEITRPTLHHLLSMTDSALQNLVFAAASGGHDVTDLRDMYQRDGVVYFPHSLCVQASFMRRITEEVVWNRSGGASNDVTRSKNNDSTGAAAASAAVGNYYPSDKTYETIRVIQKKQRTRTTRPSEHEEQQQHQDPAGKGSQHDEQQDKEHKQGDCCNDDDDDDNDDDNVVVYQERKCLTRLENFCRHHAEWNQLCTYIGRVLSHICGTEMVLYKEKLNLKPPGGSGFAPHLDTPSLLVAARACQRQQQQVVVVENDTNTAESAAGPTSFVTVMVAIDDMTDKNGCLRVVKGPWTADNAVETIVPEQNGNPDANGRAGAIPQSVADSLVFESLPAKGGTIVAFGGWVPHRSAANTSAFGRRSVFLSFNPLSQGDFHEMYYQRMQNLRNQWRKNTGLPPTDDEQVEMQALSTIPRN